MGLHAESLDESLSAAVATSGLGVLTADTEVPVVTQTAVQANLLHALEVFAQLSIHLLRDELSEFTILVVLLSVEEPVGNVELARVVDDGLDLINLILGQLPSAVEANGRKQIQHVRISVKQKKNGNNAMNHEDERSHEVNEETKQKIPKKDVQ